MASSYIEMFLLRKLYIHEGMKYSKEVFSCHDNGLFHLISLKLPAEKKIMDDCLFAEYRLIYPPHRRAHVFFHPTGGLLDKM